MQQGIFSRLFCKITFMQHILSKNFLIQYL
jgi:hypothetical protein